jgi:hypothetical protein
VRPLANRGAPGNENWRPAEIAPLLMGLRSTLFAPSGRLSRPRCRLSGRLPRRTGGAPAGSVEKALPSPRATVER